MTTKSIALLAVSILAIAGGIVMAAQWKSTSYAFNRPIEFTNPEDLWVGILIAVSGAVVAVLTIAREVSRIRG